MKKQVFGWLMELEKAAHDAATFFAAGDKEHAMEQLALVSRLMTQIGERWNEQ